MKAKIFVKNIMINIPYGLGRYFSYVPFSWRLGSAYAEAQKLIEKYDALSEDKKIAYIVSKLDTIVSHASQSFTFYTDLYDQHGVLGEKIKYLDDILKYPVVTKEMIRPFTDQFNGAMKINTGGTSGEPFSFCIDKDAFSREWAHMHKIWSLKDYVPRDLKVTLRGKNLGHKNIIYNPVHNEFIINTYKSIRTFEDELLQLFSNRKIAYIHGYPSAIYEFFRELDGVLDSDGKAIVKKNIVACFFGSEFPVPYMKQYLENVWSFDCISWYGHSEMAILAYDENIDNKYIPFMTYGYAEVLGGRLIGTSYNNTDMPLIRYDTGDIVEGSNNDAGLLESFTIKEGRAGDFIVDNNGKNIPLTALVFGRHHKIFDIAEFVQVLQRHDATVVFYVTLKNNNTLEIRDMESLFDLTNVDIDKDFKIISSPVRSKAGKIKLKIKEVDIS